MDIRAKLQVYEHSIGATPTGVPLLTAQNNLFEDTFDSGQAESIDVSGNTGIILEVLEKNGAVKRREVIRPIEVQDYRVDEEKIVFLKMTFAYVGASTDTGMMTLEPVVIPWMLIKDILVCAICAPMADEKQIKPYVLGRFSKISYMNETYRLYPELFGGLMQRGKYNSKTYDFRMCTIGLYHKTELPNIEQINTVYGIVCDRLKAFNERR